MRLCEHTFVLQEGSILHADLDAFYASVEQRDDPRLRGRPVLVGAGVVLAASYEAKAYGVETPMALGLARRLCADALVVPPRMSAYAEASRAVYRVFEDTAPPTKCTSGSAFHGGMTRRDVTSAICLACLRASS